MSGFFISLSDQPRARKSERWEVIAVPSENILFIFFFSPCSLNFFWIGSIIFFVIVIGNVPSWGFQRGFNPLAGCRAVLYTLRTHKSKALPCGIYRPWQSIKPLHGLPSSTASGPPSPLAFYKKSKGKARAGLLLRTYARGIASAMPRNDTGQGQGVKLLRTFAWGIASSLCSSQ
jgi:hypothetical protein